MNDEKLRKDAARWKDNRVQYFEPTKHWRLTTATGTTICEGRADDYEAAMEATRSLVA